MTERTEPKDRLWILTASPVIWGAHFLVCYAVVSVWCAKTGGSLVTVRILIAAITLLALAGTGLIGIQGFRKAHSNQDPTPYDRDTPEDRHRFIGYATFLLSALSAVAVGYEALVAVFFSRCY